MIICSRNVRGLNNPLKIGEIKELIRDNKITCFDLLETRVKIHNKVKIRGKFGNQWKRETNCESSPKGRIWLVWDPSRLSLQVLQKSVQMVHCEIKAKNSGLHVGLTVVYGGISEKDLGKIWNR